MTIYTFRYFANRYANGGNWTHIAEIYHPETGLTVCKVEDDRATDIKRKFSPFLSGNNTLHLCDRMKYREDFCSSLLLSEKDVEYLKNDKERNTYFSRNADKATTSQ
jgi:hypothetical protein